MEDNSLILSTHGVTKNFGEFIAVDNVDFELRQQETVGIIGPNGAGKTTFLNILTGFYVPEQGQVYSGGVDITHYSPEKRAALGIARTFQLVHVFDNLSVRDNMALSFFRKNEDKALSLRMFFGTLFQDTISKKVQESLEMFELEHLKNELVGNLSLGSKKLLELAMAFVAEPKVLVLDEPFAGLGDHEIDEVVAVLKKYTHDKTILVVEHKISKLKECVDNIAVMHEGRVICYGECEETLNHPEVRRCYWKLS